MTKKTKTVTKKKTPVRLHEIFEMTWRTSDATNTSQEFNEKMMEFIKKHGVEIVHGFAESDCWETLNLLLRLFTTTLHSFRKDILSHHLSNNADKALIAIMLHDLFGVDMAKVKIVERKH